MLHDDIFVTCLIIFTSILSTVMIINTFKAKRKPEKTLKEESEDLVKSYNNLLERVEDLEIRIKAHNLKVGALKRDRDILLSKYK
ncbi:gp160 [Sphingomonas phage PAU]|uniref:gp160 n=1 Tax=Sphingomonas phage PAU TaxID=1150991 RepID=UPI00025732EC|nr:gp160 [Sphingomonas phage PAU]AFF28158.1 gp160 [Sphingomonas phage PAU]